MSKKDPSTKHTHRMTRPWSSTALGSMFALFASQSVHAAEGATTLGVPSWIFVVLAIIILGAVCLIPVLKKKSNKTTISKDLLKPTQKKPTPQKPAAQKPTPQKPVQPKAPVAQPAPAKKAEVAPAPVAPAPVAKVEPKVEPVVVPTPAPAPVPVDAMVEAKQLLDQQRIPQAVGVLNKGLQREPERTDLMLELLTIYSKQNHHEEFDELFEQLAKLDDPLALIQAEELRNQLEPLVVEDDRGIIEYQKAHPPVAAEPVAEPEPVAETQHETLAFTLDDHAEKQPEPTAPAAHEEFDLSAFDSDHSFELEKIEPITPADQGKAMDFTFSDDLVAPKPVATPTATPDLEFKLPEAVVEPVVAPTSVEAKSEDTGLVDLEFDLDDSFALDDGQNDKETAKTQAWTTDLGTEDFAHTAKSVTPAVQAVPVPEANPLFTTLDEEFPFLNDVDPQQTCLELAKSYISLSETNSARELLDQVIEMGTATQQTEARALIAKLAS